MITIWILDRLGINLAEASTYWYIAGFEFILVEVPVVAYLISYIRWSLL
jgi:hypothetical protein